MKILYVITGADIGGAQKHVMHLVEGFAEIGCEVSVVTGEEGPLVEWLKEKGIEVTVIPIPRTIQLKGDWLAYRQLRKHLKTNKYDVVHCHSSKAGIIGRLAAFVSRVPKIVFTAHGFVFTDPTLSKKKKAFYIFLEKVFGALSTDLITVSKYDYQAGISVGINPKKLHTIHNGIPSNQLISLSEWEKKQERLRKKQKKIIGFVGRLVSEKNVDMLIRLAALTEKNAQMDTEFWIIGDGKLEEKYRKDVHELGLEDQVLFWGNQEDVLDLMDQMHLLLITSHKEGLPYVLLEAMGRGLPVISTDVGGVKEVLDPDEKHGLTVPINKDQAMFRKIITLLENDHLREQIGKSILEYAEECVSGKMVEKVKKIYIF